MGNVLAASSSAMIQTGFFHANARDSLDKHFVLKAFELWRDITLGILRFDGEYNRLVPAQPERVSTQYNNH